MGSEQPYDVAVVGYGPVGQSLAALLGQAGLRVVVLEKHRELFGMPRAGHLDHEILRLLQKLGLAADLERRFQPARLYQLVNAEGTLLHEVHGGETGCSGWMADYTMAQPDLETALDRAARSFSNVQIRQGAEVVAVSEDDDLVTLRVVEDRGESVVRARYAVGVDGAGSFVRTACGIGQQDLGFAASWLVIDVELNDPDEVLIDSFDGSVLLDGRQWCDPKRPISAFRWIGRRRSRWEVMLTPDETPEMMQSETVHWQYLARWGVTPANAVVARHAVYTFRSLLAQRWRSGRILLAGDAAHSMPPFLGQGLCSGFRDAANLAWKLALVVDGADPRILDSYEDERRPHAQSLIELSMMIGRSVCEQDPAAAAARDAMFLSDHTPPPPRLPGLARGIVQQDANGHPSAIAGHLSLQARVSSGDRTALLDDVIGSGWHVLTQRPLPAGLLAPRHLALLDALGARVVQVSCGAADDALVDIDGGYADWFRVAGCSVIVVRPDFYTYGGVSDVGGLPALLDELAPQLPGLVDTAALQVSV